MEMGFFWGRIERLIGFRLWGGGTKTCHQMTQWDDMINLNNKWIHAIVPHSTSRQHHRGLSSFAENG